MSGSLKKFMVMTMALVLVGAMAAASGNVSFSFSSLSGTNWGTSGETTAEGENWDVRIDTISNHGVGRVFEYPSYNWGSGLYTYGPSSTGWRPVKKYSGVVHGDNIVWRMRLDTDYSGTFSCSGLFRP